jgi:cytochrome c oxidase subunit 4
LTDHPHASEHIRPPEQAHPVEHPHPTAAVYLKVAAVLAIITAIEVAVYYVLVGDLGYLLPPALIALSALKFGLVAAFYMHLKFDHKLFTAFFVGGLLLAASVVLALMTLFGVWTRVPIISH